MTKSAEETREFGKKIGAFLLPGDVVALSGELGAGKTTLIQGMAEGLGVKEHVTSPTFIIINEYQGRWPLYHLDLYRLEQTGQVGELGLEEYFTRPGICLIEWAERLVDFLPATAEKIELRIKSENERELCVSSGLAARLN